MRRRIERKDRELFKEKPFQEFVKKRKKMDFEDLDQFIAKKHEQYMLGEEAETPKMIQNKEEAEKPNFAIDMERAFERAEV